MIDKATLKCEINGNLGWISRLKKLIEVAAVVRFMTGSLRSWVPTMHINEAFCVQIMEVKGATLQLMC